MTMKKQVELLIILFTIVLSSFIIVYRIIPCARATYVEGVIAQDTEWTLVDSPFVLSDNVTVMPSATLTIEPGVEVRFGGDFSLIIEGAIVAIGTSNRKIHFTTNDPSHNATWRTIVLDGSQPSSFMNCIIEYGTDGMTVEDNSLEVESSSIAYNSGNGITVNNGNVLVKNSEIIGNENGGIYIAGGAQVIVENNLIHSNGDGIVLTGNLPGVIDVEQNTISSNTQSGIVLESEVCETTGIVRNTILGNNNGFLVRTNASTHIGWNYISNNTVGIYYENGDNHEAHFNDIYGNALGMDVSSASGVNATRNYWGHRSGPLHASLNPLGKGNPVGGNGVNLDFVFFLTASTDYNNELPTAVLWTDKMSIAPNQNVTFIGTDSYDDGRVDQYIFDFGDGTGRDWTTLSLFNHSYSSTGTYTAGLRVLDDFGAASEYIAVTTITVQNLPSLSVSIMLGNDTVDNNEDVPVTVFVSNELGGFANAYVTLFSVRGGSFSPFSGFTNSTGYLDTIFTAPNVTDISDIRIIARATTDWYADGSDHKYVRVLPPLTIRIEPELTTVKSEETATITLNVTGGFGQPVANASLTLTSDNGNLSTMTGFTDADGILTFNFTAPYTLSQMNSTITATAVKSGFADGYSQKTIVVEPKMLSVEITAEPLVTVSEAKVAVTVHVTYDTAPVQNATVTIASENAGNFSQPTAITDAQGTANFTLTATQANAQVDATITAQASKSGYADGQSSLSVTINPRTFSVVIKPNLLSIMSSNSVAVTVYVASDSAPVAGAQVTVSASAGNFSVTAGFTGSDGNCTFMFNAPRTTTQMSVSIVANVSKNGYVDAGNQTKIDIVPEATETGGGFPLLTVLLIVIPIVIAIVIMVLIKLKVIVISVKEEET